MKDPIDMWVAWRDLVCLATFFWQGSLSCRYFHKQQNDNSEYVPQFFFDRHVHLED